VQRQLHGSSSRQNSDEQQCDSRIAMNLLQVQPTIDEE